MSDYGMNSISGLASAMEQQTFGAQVVTKTLDYMNQNHGSSSGHNADYDFQKSVLGAAYSPKGIFSFTV